MDVTNTGPRSYLVPQDSRPWPEMIEGPSRKAVLAEVGRAVAAGELAASGPLEALPGGRYQVAVWRIRERQVVRRWKRPLLVAGGVAVALGLLAAAGWWLVGATTALVATVSLPLLVGGGAVVVLMWLATRRAGGGCETTVTVRHRHW